MGITGVSSTMTSSNRQEITFHGGETVVATQPNGGASEAEQARRLSSTQVCLQDNDTTVCENAETAEAVQEATARRDGAIQRVNDQRAVRAALSAALDIPRPARSAPGGVSSARDAEAFRQCGERTRTSPNAGMIVTQVVSGAVSVAGAAAHVAVHSAAHAAGHVAAEVGIDFVVVNEIVGHLAHSNDPRSSAEHIGVATTNALLPGVGTLGSSMAHALSEGDARIQCMENAAQQARRNRLEGVRDADRVHDPARPLDGINVQRMRTDRDYYDGVVSRLRERSVGHSGARG
jgi:hypothetical protein